MLTMERTMSVWRLRLIMADKQITNHELSKRINEITGRNTHPVTISKWRQQNTMPKIDGIELDAIVDALGVTRNELLGDK